MTPERMGQIIDILFIVAALGWLVVIAYGVLFT